MHRSRAFMRFAIFTLLVLALVGAVLTPVVSAPFQRRPAADQPARHQSAVASQQSPAARPQQQPEDALPPVLVATTPAADAAWEGGPVTLTFDQPLDPALAAHLRVEPALAGDIKVDGDSLIFTPAAPPQPGTRYTFRLDPPAGSAATLGAPVEFSITAAIPLQVTSVQPDDGAAEVDTVTQIIIAFNRPVVPLTGIDDQEGLPNPLTIEPPVEGKGRWLNTSVYAFRPATAFAGATDYTVTVADVVGLQGETLAEPVVFSFTTAAPIVVDAAPAGSQVRPDAAIRVEFSQPMDRESTEAAFHLRRTGDEGGDVEGEVAWLNADRTLIFTPTQPLEFGNRYVIEVTSAAQPASRQGTLRADFTRSFSVAPLPAVQTVSPVNGADEVSPDASVIVRFNAPVSPTLVLENIQVTPLLTTTQVFSYYSEYLNELQLSWFKEPRTTYTVTIGAGIADEYGNTLGEDYVLTFTTGDYPPFVRLETERFTHFSAFSDTRVSLLYRNVTTVTVDLYRLPEDELFKLTGSNQWQAWENYQLPNPTAHRIWSRTYEAADATNITVRQVVTLTDTAGDPLPPGVYFLQVAQPPAAPPPNAYTSGAQSLIVLSNHNLMLKWSQDAASLAWLTDLQTGQPVAGQPVRFFRDGVLVGDGITGDDGTVQIEIEPDPERRWAPVLAMVAEPGDPNFALVSSEWASGIAVWDFGLNGGWTLDPLQSYFYTDRPIYRPGQTVYWKGIVRWLEDDHYRLPPDELVAYLTVRDPLGNAILEEERTLGPHGTIDGAIQLSDEALTGGYYMEVRLEMGDAQPVYAGLSFPVAAYRKPEFEVTLASEKPEYFQGETVRVHVQATYYSGGPMANAPVTWRLISEPYFFFWEQAPEGRYFSFTPFDPDQADYDPYRGSLYLGIIREGTGQTGSDGSFTIELPADLAGAPQSQNWVFDVTVQSPTNQFVSSRTAAPIHKAAYYIGLSPQNYVTVVEDESVVDMVTVTPQGEPYADAELALTVYEFQWNNVYARSADGVYRWETSVQRTPVYSETVTTGAGGEATFTWTPTVAGQYQVVAIGEDADGNRTSSSTFLWVSAA
ncbi:MAG TPA: Ig-like domain-containing protein, partial [Caldilineaceae bacterium]|nr:Ig-like domain-containing protein [Caldilineaceae bacterium]